MNIFSRLAFVSALVALTFACSSDDEGGGDGDSAAGDGDMSAGDGDGDGDLSTGDGDGDGDGDLSTGDGDLSIGDGDGDGDITVGDGDGDVGTACVVDLNCVPEPIPSSGDFAQDCVDRINQFRACFCDDDGNQLQPLVRWTEAEACADANAEYDEGTGQAHSGWPDAACPDESGPLARENAGWATNECPGWGSESQIVSGCLASMFSEGADWATQLGRNPMQSDFSDCSGDFANCYLHYGHFIAMTKASHTHVACGVYDGGDGNVWSVQNFK